MKNVLAILPFIFAATVMAERTFTVTNKCGYTVWPAVSILLDPLRPAF